MVAGGIFAMHDTIRKKWPQARVLWQEVFRSDRIQEIARVDNITARRKLMQARSTGSDLVTRRTSLGFCEQHCTIVKIAPLGAIFTADVAR